MTTTLNRREFLGGLAASLLPAQTLPGKPNIIFILADDLGYGDLGCYGQQRISTPNLDRIAAEGLRFTQAYSGCTVCAPSRCALITGLHTGHARIRANSRVPLEPGDTNVAKVLKSAGYHTGIIGKWGLGEAGTPGIPNLQGFDEWFGYLNQQHAHTYYPDHLWDNQRELILGKNLGLKQQYSHDLFTERALDFVGRQKAGAPFFLYLAYTIPHANDELGNDTGNGMEVPSDAPYSGKDWPQQEKNFAAMVTRMDTDIGKIMAQLKTSGMDQNTVVFFTSDNGPHQEGGHDPKFFKSGGPLRGIKRDLYEGGIRVPSMVRWPGKVQAGRTSDEPWAFWDFLPTAAELAGAPIPAGIDGISMAPAILGKPQNKHEYLYWEFHERGFSQAVRLGDWKGVRVASRQAPIELYDLKKDLGETTNLAAQRPEIVARIAKIMSDGRTDSTRFPVREPGKPKKKG